MGKALQIRVSASTFDPDDVEKYWPKLFRIAWPKENRPLRHPIGVLEMVGEMDDQLRFGNLGVDVQKILKEYVGRAWELRKKIEAALAEWKPSEAHALSEELETLLDELESKLPKE